jgi:hypothetical protein
VRRELCLLQPIEVFNSKAVYCRQNRFRPGTHTDIICQIFPTNGACSIHDELRGPRDVFAFFAAFGMQHPVATDGVSFGVGKKREGIPAGLTELLRFSGRIHADSHDFDTTLMKLVQMPLETPQLGVAERSPVTTIENQHKSAMVL